MEFGVVLANEKGIVNTGCTATIDRVLREYPDGRMDILTRGRRRFEIVRLNDERAFSARLGGIFRRRRGIGRRRPMSRQRAIEGFQRRSRRTPLDLDAVRN